MKLYCKSRRCNFGIYDTDSLEEAIKLADFELDDEGNCIDDLGAAWDLCIDDFELIPDHQWKVFWNPGGIGDAGDNEKFFDDSGEAYNFAVDLSREWEEKGIFDEHDDATIDIIDQYANDYRGKALEWW